MHNYSISYYKGSEFKYVDSKMYESAANASVRAIFHIFSHSEDIDGAAIIYQGKKVTKRVRSIRCWNHDTNHK